ncbi:MAG: negative regulator of flagellin synthesis FlgM [Clostridia bacterium]|jgi:negative regulator of flagellin synthesis FlgM|nr:negative regulator of flagellin synthesis FlgM [Clostridia bacterium]
MKIHNIPGILKAYNQKKVQSKSKVYNVQGKKDEMQVSNEAQVMSKILQRAKNAPEIREQKVNEIKNAIKQGTYNVTADDVAEKMLNGIIFDKKG